MAQSNGSLETSNQTQQTPQNSDASVGSQLGLPESKAPKNQQQGKPEGEEKKLSLADLFKRENPDDPDDTSFSVEDEDDDPSKPVDSLDKLSKRLKMKPEDIYKIKVPLANGAEPMTLGDMKDRVGELVDLDARELEFTNRRVKGEGELLRAQNELRSLMALIPKDKLTPELINKVRMNHEATQTRERQLTLEHIPSWNDEQTRTTDIQHMVEMLNDYGFDDGFIATVVDHRAMKFIRDTMLMRRRIQKALSEVKIPTRKGKTPSQRTGKPAVREQEPRGTRASKVPSASSRLMDLIKGSGSD